MKKYLPALILLISVLFFLFLKFSTLGVRLSDTNIYFYTGYKLLEGNILYKDIFFTNLPLFAYIASFYFTILQGNLPLFYFTSPLEISCVALLIFYITFKKTQKYSISLTCSLAYLFSFIVLSTSDHQTGVSTATLLIVLSFLFFDKKNYFFSGIFSALALLVKAYFIPISLAFFIFLLIKKDFKNIFLFSLSAITTTFVVLLPTLFLARNEFIHNIFFYSLSRDQGVSKVLITWFFMKHDFMLFLLLFFSLFLFRQQLLFALISLFSLIFFLLYKDTYYLYFNFLIPFLILSLPHVLFFFEKKFSFSPVVGILIVSVFTIMNIIVYVSSYSTLQKVETIEKIALDIKREHPSFLYGFNSLTPALSYITNVPLLENIIDTNDSIFTKGLLDKKTLTTKAINEKTIIVTQGAEIEELGVNDLIVGGAAEKTLVLKHCKRIQSYPVYAEGWINRIHLFKCY